MKKIIIASAAFALASTPAFAAPTDSDTVAINASVAKECSIEDITTVTLGNIAIDETPGVNALQITGQTTQNANLVWVSCNFTNQMTLSTPTPLVSASAASLTASTGSAAFTNQINYRFRAANYGNSPEARSFDLPTRNNQTGPIHKQIQFRAIVDAADNVGARPFAATDYTATATVSITTL